MSKNVPTIKKIGWLSLIPQMMVIALLMFLWYLIKPEIAMIAGAVTYLALSFTLRNTLTKQHRMGMRSVLKGQFQEAIPYFQKSYDFFTNNEWLDKYRYLTILSSSKISFKEMALVNIAYCYGQMGDGTRCRAFYEKALIEFPDSAIAATALNMLDAVKQAQ